MSEIEPRDKRGYFMLPQSNDAGYYTYGTPNAGQGQYANPKLLNLIFWLAFRWSGMDERKFGIGNISLAGGGAFKGHKDHKNGLEVDIRPLRKDGKDTRVSRFESEYDTVATGKLIRLFEIRVWCRRFTSMISRFRWFNIVTGTMIISMLR